MLAIPPLLSAIAQGLTRVSGQLAAGDGIWTASRDDDLGPPAYRELLRLITNSPLLGPTVRDALVSDARAVLGGGDDAVMPSTVIGPLLAPSAGRNRFDLSPKATRLQSSLAVMNGFAFMHARSALTALPELKPGLVRWDQRMLEMAVAMTGEHALFLVRDLPTIPEPLRPGIRAIARDQLVASVFDLADRAQIALPPDMPGGAREAELAAMAASTAAAAPLFRRLSDGLRQADDPVSAERLMAALETQAVAVLDRAAALLDANPIYQPPTTNLAEWYTGGMDVPKLYEELDMAAVNAILTQERLAIAGLLHDVVEPILTVVSGEEMAWARGQPSVRMWSGIAEDLDVSGQRRPNGSLAALEQFISVDLPALKPGVCPPTLAWSGTGNWFAAQLAKLRDGLAKQCGLAASNLATTSYQQIQQSFQTYLAGRYPFAPLSEASSGPYAGANDIAMFYRDFDAQAGGLIEAFTGTIGVSRGHQDAAQFIETMRQLRAVLAPLAGLGGATEPGLLLEPRFRALPSRENADEEVIEERLTVAGVASDDVKHRPLIWHTSDPISVSFRWALNAQHLPVTISNAIHPSVNGGTVTASYDHPWALVTLVRQHRASPAEWLADPGQASQMLAFEIPMTRANGKPSDDPPARLFIDLAIRQPPLPAGAAAAPAAERLPLPDFPAEAPPFFAVRSGVGGFQSPSQGRSRRPTHLAEAPAFLAPTVIQPPQAGAGEAKPAETSATLTIPAVKRSVVTDKAVQGTVE